MRLIQFRTEHGERRVARVDAGAGEPICLEGVETTRELALEAIARGRPLAALVEERTGTARVDYARLLAEARVLAPLDHPDPAHLLVTGTGLTHTGSAAARDQMHQVAAAEEASLSDSMKMFRLGLEGGKPADGGVGVAPEWFYKGSGHCVVAPEAPLVSPAFALDAGEEAEIAGLYVIAPDGTPWRLGYALANEFSDHVTERRNYLYLAHSKLRACAYGPELLVGALPEDVTGQVRIRRGNGVLWEQAFKSGEANMCHALANLEHHHFKYDLFRQPGDAHVHFFGAAVLSCTDGIETREGDLFEIECAAFGRPLRNPLRIDDAPADRPVAVKAL